MLRAGRYYASQLKIHLDPVYLESVSILPGEPVHVVVWLSAAFKHQERYGELIEFANFIITTPSDYLAYFVTNSGSYALITQVGETEYRVCTCNPEINVSGLARMAKCIHNAQYDSATINRVKIQ